MTPSIALLLGITALALVLFMTEKFPIAQVAMGIPAVLIVTGLLSPAQAVAGFSAEATITIAAMLVLSMALTNSGVVRDIANAAQRLQSVGPRSRLALLTLGAAAVSPFLNNTAVVVVFLPVFIALAKRDGESPSLYLMPLSFAAILGGTVSLIGTSTNLVVSGMAVRRGLTDLNVFSITPLGMIVLAVGMTYMWTVGRWLMPRRSPSTGLEEHYGSRNYVSELSVDEGSPLVGRTLRELGWREAYGLDVVGHRRDGALQTFREPLAVKDRITVRGEADALRDVANDFKLTTRTAEERARTHMVEVMVTPGSPITNSTLAATRFEERFGCTVLAVHQQQEQVRRRLAETVLHTGDIMLIEGTPAPLADLVTNHGFAGLTEMDRPTPSGGRLVTLMLLIGVVGLAGLGVTSIMASSVVGAVLAVFLGRVRVEQVYEQLDWGVLFLLAGTLPLGLAMEETGAAAWISGQLGSGLDGLPPMAVVAILYLFTSVATEVMSNNAAAIVLTPIALELAVRLDMNPYALLVTVMFGASAAFMSPMGYQTNTMVYGPGGYKFTDYIRVGGPLNLILAGVVSVFVPIFWP